MKKTYFAFLAALPLVLSSCISLLPSLPTVTIEADEWVGVAPFSVSFQAHLALAKPDPKTQWTYHWDFGDGAMGEGGQAAHTYAAPGRYRVVLALSDDEGFSTERTMSITALAEPRFELERLATGLTPTATAAIDVNMDGRPDLVTANAQSHSISVFVAQEGGFAGSPYQYPAIKSPSPELQPQFIGIGDFNRDTLQDLIVINSPDDNVTLLFGNGRGGFDTPSGYRISKPRMSLTADFNADGNQDVVVLGTSGSNSRLVMMYGRGTGELTLGQTILEQFAIADVTKGDFDRDGDVDLAIASQAFGFEYRVLLNDRGAFQSLHDGLMSAKPNAMVAMDFDSDGALDLVTGNTDGSITLLKGLGTGAFEELGSLTTALGQISKLVVGDLNGDGADDVVMQYQRQGQVDIALLLGDGQGAFSKPYPISGLSGAACPVVADADGDGRKELIMVNPQTNELLIAWNRTPR